MVVGVCSCASTIVARKPGAAFDLAQEVVEELRARGVPAAIDVERRAGAREVERVPPCRRERVVERRHRERVGRCRCTREPPRFRGSEPGAEVLERVDEALQAVPVTRTPLGVGRAAIHGDVRDGLDRVATVGCAQPRALRPTERRIEEVKQRFARVERRHDDIRVQPFAARELDAAHGVAAAADDPPDGRVGADVGARTAARPKYVASA